MTVSPDKDSTKTVQDAPAAQVAKEEVHEEKSKVHVHIDPRNLPETRKKLVTIVTSLDAFVVSFTSTVISPAMTEIMKEFKFRNETIAALCVCVFILPWVFVPLIGSPLSEIYGRRVVILSSMWILFLFNIGCCWAQNKETLIVCRFLSGFSSSVLSVGPGALGDVYNNKDRNRAIGLYAVSLCLAPVSSPIIAGFVVQNVGWRWVMKITLILNAAIIVVNQLFLEETYSPVVNARAQNKPKWYQVVSSAPTVQSSEVFKENLVRPLQLLFFHPMVYGLGAFLAYINGLLYLMIVIFPTVWEQKYHFSVGISGLMFASMGVGFVLGICTWTPLIDLAVARGMKKSNGVFKPEFRLHYLSVGAIIGPSAMLVFGWTVQYHVLWICPCIFAAIFGFAVVNVFQIVNNYLIDMCPKFSASSIAAATVYRSLFGFTFPLFAPKFYEKLHYGWGNTLFFFVGIALGLPYPVYAYYKGEHLREWGNARMEKFSGGFSDDDALEKDSYSDSGAEKDLSKNNPDTSVDDTAVKV